jgi:hypothetical protein
MDTRIVKVKSLAKFNEILNRAKKTQRVPVYVSKMSGLHFLYDYLIKKGEPGYHIGSINSVRVLVKLQLNDSQKVKVKILD